MFAKAAETTPAPVARMPGWRLSRRSLERAVQTHAPQAPGGKAGRTPSGLGLAACGPVRLPSVS